VESRRYADGKVAHRHVLYLGEINDIKRVLAQRSGIGKSCPSEGDRRRGAVADDADLVVEGNEAHAAVRVQAAFGRGLPPSGARWATQWESAELRNDAVVIEVAIPTPHTVRPPIEASTYAAAAASSPADIACSE
jgi:hypothetical protein